MSIKYFLQIASLVLLLGIGITASSAIISDSLNSNGSAKTEESRAQQLINYHEEIKVMDKSKLKSHEKKKLLKEVRASKKS